MKNYLIPFALLLLTACNNAPEKKSTVPNDSGQVSNNARKGAIDNHAVINELLLSFNEIQDNLDKIKSKEKVLNLNFKDRELQLSNKDQIKADIEYIYDLLNKNRQTLLQMREKLNDSTLKINALENFIANISKQLGEKELEINSLKKQVRTLNLELHELNVNMVKVQKEANLKTKELNTAYCAIGTFEELKKEGVMNEKGGIVGIGTTKELNPNFVKGMFNAVDINETKKIDIAAKKIKLISFHPSDSYTLDDSKQLTIKKLIILDPVKFWSTSKYLVIQISI